MGLNTPATMIPIEGIPIGWLFLITPGSPATIAEAHLFDDLQQMSYNAVVPEEDNAGNIDILRADGANIRFPKTNLTIDGTDETTLANSAAVGDETLKGEINMTVNEASITSTSWSSFIQSLIDNHGAKWLVCIPTGVTYASREGLGGISTPQPDGYAFMIGTITNNIENLVSENPTSIALNFKSVKNANLDVGDLEVSPIFTGIDWKRGDNTVSALKPSVKGTVGEIDSTEEAALYLGELVVREEIDYTALP